MLFPGVRMGSPVWTEGRGNVLQIQATRRTGMDNKCSVFKRLSDNWGERVLEQVFEQKGKCGDSILGRGSECTKTWRYESG